MTDLDKAREWAQWAEVKLGIAESHSDALAAAEIIQSLPDQWVDVEKVREIIEEMKSLPATTGVASEIAIATEAWKRRLEVLVPPKLPTLADMTETERKECQWMQCKVETDHEDVIGVIRRVWSKSADVMFQSGQSIDPEHRRVTPLPDLPKLQWPGSEVVEPPALPEGMRLADHEECGRVVVSPKTDTHGHYSVLCLDIGHRTGASYHYAKPNHLTFLDGEA